MKVVLVEFIDEFEALESFIARKSLSFSDFVIVAMDPVVGAHIKQCGYNCVNTLPYFNNASHIKMITETQKNMDSLERYFVFTDDLGLKNCYQTTLSNYVRFYLNHLFKILEVLENVVAQNPRCELWGFVREYISSALLIAPRERFCGELTKRLAAAKNLKFVDFAGEKSASVVKNKSQGFSFLEKIYAQALLCAIKKKKVVLTLHPSASWQSLSGKISQCEGGVVFLALDYAGLFFKMVTYNALVWCRSLRRSKKASYYYINPQFLCSLAPALEELENKLSLLTNNSGGIRCVYGSVDCSDLVQKKIDASFRGQLVKMYQQARGLSVIFSTLKNKAVLSYSGLDTMGVVSELARQRKVDAIFVSHGAHPAPVDKYHEIELANLCRVFMLGDYTHIALASPVQEEHLKFFKNKNKNLKNIEVKTGSLIFSDISGEDKVLAKRNLGLLGSEYVVTHAVTTKNRSSERFHFLETVDEILASLADVADAVLQNKNMHLIVRLHPGFYLSDKAIKSFLPKSERILLQRTGSFADVLAATDILASYSSTAIDEALLNSIPVVLYDKWSRYNHFRAPSYCRHEPIDKFLPITYVNEPVQLNLALRAIYDKIVITDKVKMDTRPYVYSEDHRENFYKLIAQAFKPKGDVL